MIISVWFITLIIVSLKGSINGCKIVKKEWEKLINLGIIIILNDVSEWFFMNLSDILSNIAISQIISLWRKL
jgi:hypothetical protein